MRMKWVGHAARIREMRNAHKILVRKYEGQSPFGSPRHRQKDTIKNGA
jgi:hypothetical protein